MPTTFGIVKSLPPNVSRETLGVQEEYSPETEPFQASEALFFGCAFGGCLGGLGGAF
jgi:hypothetical protein